MKDLMTVRLGSDQKSDRGSAVTKMTSAKWSEQCENAKRNRAAAELGDTSGA